MSASLYIDQNYLKLDRQGQAGDPRAGADRGRAAGVGVGAVVVLASGVHERESRPGTARATNT